MTEEFQQLTKRSGRDRFETAFWVLNLLWAIFAPLELLAALAVVGFARAFSGAMQNPKQTI
jgi:hypothetical protein